MTLFVLLCVAAALGIVELYRLGVPARPDLVGGLARWQHARSRASLVQQRTDAGNAGSLLQRPGVVVARLIQRRARDLTSTSQDLAILRAATGELQLDDPEAGSDGRDEPTVTINGAFEAFVTKMLTLALAGLLAPVVLNVVFAAGVGVSAPVVSAVVAGLCLAAVMVVLSLRDLHTEAEGRRAELRDALSTYFDLVTMCLDAGRAPEEALPAAARICRGWTFTLLQDSVELARWSRTTPGRVLGALGRAIGVPQLVDLEAALDLSWESGAQVKISMAARAGTLREQRVTDNEAVAQQATDSMRLALLPMVLALVIFELYPAIIALFTG